MNEKKPSRKVGIGAVAGALSVLIVWGFEKGVGTSVPAEVSSAFTTFLTFITSYFVNEPEA